MERYHGGKVFVDYLYVDHSRLEVCVKSRVLDFEPRKLADVPLWHASVWNVENGETPTITKSHLLQETPIKPVALFNDPFRRGRHKMVLCDVMENYTTTARWSYRNKLVETVKKTADLDILMGFEQEYYFYGDSISTETSSGFLTVDYHDKVGLVKGNALQRQMAEDHINACLIAGLDMYGYNREKARGQWEYQLGPSDLVTLADHTVMARYLLKRIAEGYNAEVTFHPFPEGRTFPSSLQLNFSTADMRTEGGISAIKDTLESMSKIPQESLLKHYDRRGGIDNAIRMFGQKHVPGLEFKVGWGVKDSSMRVPGKVMADGCGYIEERRPSSDCDPYELAYVFIKCFLKETTADKYKTSEICRNWLNTVGQRRVEDIVGKGKIARYEQFLLFPQCFQKLSAADISKDEMFGESLKWKEVEFTFTNRQLYRGISTLIHDPWVVYQYWARKMCLAQGRYSAKR